MATNNYSNLSGGIQRGKSPQYVGLNYVTNYSAEKDTTGWATYADAAGSAPVDGTGGSPTVTWTRSTSSPLRGVASFLLTKDAANRQGQGASYDFSIDTTDQAKVLNVSFDYAIASGTYADGDLTVYLYDVTNGLVIQPSGYSISNATVNMRQVANFQTASNSTSYRLIFHCASTSASAYTVKIDGVSVGPVQVINGVPITDWSSTGITFNLRGTSNEAVFTNYTFTKVLWRRVGDTMEIHAEIAFSGNPATGTGSISVAIEGYSRDTNKFSNSTYFGTATFLKSSNSNMYSLIPRILDGTNRILVAADLVDGSGTAGGLVSPSNPVSIANGDIMEIDIAIPITGWSSNVQMSADTDTRVVANKATGAISTTTSGNILVFPTKEYDTHGGYSTSTGRYTIPVPGYYSISAYINMSNASIGVLSYVNGSNSSYLGFSQAAGQMSGTAILSLKAGDLVDIRPDSTTGSIASNSHFEISRMSGPSLVAATETVTARYTGSTSTISSSVAVIKYSTLAHDTHNAYSTSTGLYTCPVAGYYQVLGGMYLTQTSTATGNTWELWIYKNGSAVNRKIQEAPSTANLDIVMDIKSTIYCVAGDTLAIYADATGPGPTIQNNSTMTFVCIDRMK